MELPGANSTSSMASANCANRVGGAVPVVIGIITAVWIRMGEGEAFGNISG